MALPKKKGKKPIKARQKVKLTGKALQKFIKQNGYDPNTSKLPNGMTLGAYEE